MVLRIIKSHSPLSIIHLVLRVQPSNLARKSSVSFKISQQTNYSYPTSDTIPGRSKTENTWSFHSPPKRSPPGKGTGWGYPRGRQIKLKTSGNKRDQSFSPCDLYQKYIVEKRPLSPYKRMGRSPLRMNSYWKGENDLL